MQNNLTPEANAAVLGITEAIMDSTGQAATQLELLKKTLTDNGFKHTAVAAHIMLAQMQSFDYPHEDAGLPQDAAAYYETLAYKYLPLS